MTFYRDLAGKLHAPFDTSRTYITPVKHKFCDNVFCMFIPHTSTSTVYLNEGLLCVCQWNTARCCVQPVLNVYYSHFNVYSVFKQIIECLSMIYKHDIISFLMILILSEATCLPLNSFSSYSITSPSITSFMFGTLSADLWEYVLALYVGVINPKPLRVGTILPYLFPYFIFFP